MISRRVNILAEHPWTICLILTAVIGICILVGLRQGSFKWLASAAAPIIGIVITVTVAWITVTPAQHASGVVETLVAAAVAGNPKAAMACFSQNATIHMGAPQQPGDNYSLIGRAFDSFANRHRIESNTIAALTAVTTSDDSGSVELACRTRTASSFGIVPTRWSFEVVREKDGIWRILRITWLRVGSEKPSLSLL